MYKLTIEFKTLEELKAFSENLGAKTAAKVIQHAEESQNEVKESAAPKKAPAKKAPAVEAPVEAPAPVTPKAAPAKAAPAIDKQALVVEAQELVNALKDSGHPTDQILPVINDAFKECGIAIGQRISALDDASLAKFMPIFRATVEKIVNAPKGHSFI